MQARGASACLAGGSAEVRVTVDSLRTGGTLAGNEVDDAAGGAAEIALIYFC